ncbi:MAG: T9SS type A sorting domain-containing protein, partial [Sphingobacteriales bacterium]
TVFEYNPAGNIFTKRADFTATSGARPWGGLTVWGNQLYGTTTYGGAADSGSIYQFDPVSSALTKRADLDYTSGTRPVNRLTSINNKLYGMMNFGGSEDQGTLIEFNPATGLLLKKKDFTKPDAGRPVTNELLAIPAPVAPGSPNSCINSQTVNINAANANEWIAFTDTEGRAVAEINANGNILGNTTVRFYVNSGPARKTGEGNYYLDRNISITRANQPLTPVSIRLYIRKKEFDDLKATPGTNLQLPSDLSVFSNSDACSPIMNSAALPVISTQENWGTDYVYSASVMNLNSFYFAKTGTVLPVQLLSFTGKREACNLLTWKASCTQETLFDLEKSTDGQQFSSIYNVQASTQDCNQAFTYNDCHAGSGKTFYRLRMQETGGPVLYSPQVVLKGDETAPGIIRLLNNPVQGSTAQLQISGKENTAALLTLTDMAGKKLWTKQLTAQPGTQTIALDVSAFTAGMYYLVYDDDRERKVVKMMRQ